MHACHAHFSTNTNRLGTTTEAIIRLIERRIMHGEQKFCYSVSQALFSRTRPLMDRSIAPFRTAGRCFPNAYRLTKLDHKRLKLNEHMHKALAIVPAAGCTFSGLLFRHFLFVHMFFYICDQICKKGSYTRTTSMHRFCHHSIATPMY